MPSFSETLKTRECGQLGLTVNVIYSTAMCPAAPMGHPRAGAKAIAVSTAEGISLLLGLRV